MLIIPSSLSAETQKNDLSGKCGDNAYWNYNETSNTITVSGTGEITSCPWENYLHLIDGFFIEVVIDNGITKLPKDAFKYMWISDVIIGADVEEIGERAFEQ